MPHVTWSAGFGAPKDKGKDVRKVQGYIFGPNPSPFGEPSNLPLEPKRPFPAGLLEPGTTETPSDKGKEVSTDKVNEKDGFLTSAMQKNSAANLPENFVFGGTKILFPDKPVNPPGARAKALADAANKANAANKGGPSSEANPVEQIRPPRPARRDYTWEEGSIGKWDTPWNLQSPPPQPSQPQVQHTSTDLSAMFPPDFPRFHSIQSLNDFGAYLANASYMVSVGGPPLADIKYGIILVPAGEERLLFGQQPDMPASNRLKEALRYPRDMLGLHDLDKDSQDFLRRRNVPRDHNTESAVASVYSAGVGRQTTQYAVNGADKVRAENAQAENAQAENARAENVQAENTQTGNAQTGNAQTGNAQAGRDRLGAMQTQPTEMDGPLPTGEDDIAMSDAGPAVQGGVPRSAANRKGKKQAAASLRTASKPQGVAKKSSAPPKKTVRADNPAGQPATSRALRSRKVKI